MNEMKKLRLGVNLVQSSELLKDLVMESKGHLDSDTIEVIKSFGKLCSDTVKLAEIHNTLGSMIDDLEKMGS